MDRASRMSEGRNRATDEQDAGSSAKHSITSSHEGNYPGSAGVFFDSGPPWPFTRAYSLLTLSRDSFLRRPYRPVVSFFRKGDSK